MALTYSKLGELGSVAPGFSLRGVDEVHHHLSDFRNSRVLVLAFICNHCPYVQAVIDRMNQLARELAEKSVQVVGICSNDSTRYPADDFPAMQRWAKEKEFAFPYLWDETQEVAKAYGAVCTPDFYVYENRTAHKDPVEFVLRYRGELDDSWKDPAAVKQRALADAVKAILGGGVPRLEQKPSLGCSIKWR